MRLSLTAFVSAFVAALSCTGIASAATDAISNDPEGKVLLVWVWLLPISGILCIAAYVFVMGQMNRSWAAAAARRGERAKNVGFFV
jgi:hypothetical protein